MSPVLPDTFTVAVLAEEGSDDLAATQVYGCLLYTSRCV